MKPSLCLNMIVKNESARIARALNSALPFVKAVVILDTGSNDDTVDIIADLCQNADVPYIIETGEFRDFGYARNSAWAMAKRHNGHHTIPWCQFALLMDADMELQVKEGYNFEDLDAQTPAYNMIQKGGAVSYHNTRIVNLKVAKDDIYVGVTHEYVDVPANIMLNSASFIDYADGANRKDKFMRDATLLENALKIEPNNGRYLYYLGQSYKDWAATDPTVLPYAIDAYNKRIKLGGWDEETHQAMMSLAECWKMRGGETQFVHGMIEAYQFRPQRAEPLYELAKHYRVEGKNHASLLFSKAGVKLPRPNDVLFVNDFVYEHGLRYELSVAGYYNEADRNTSFQITDDLALDPTCPHDLRYSARTNLYWHTKPLKAYCPSFVSREINFLPPRGYTAMNPSIEVCNYAVKCNVRCVNYKIDEHGRYMIGPKECNDAPIDTRNFILTLNPDTLDTEHSREILWDRPQAKWDMVTGLEDVRLYRAKGELCFSACIREQASNGTCQQIRGALAHDIDDKYFHTVDTHIMSGEDVVEKNWMPMPGGFHDFVYRLNTIIHMSTTPHVKTVHPTKLHLGDISGGSQCIEFRHGLLCVVHEAIVGPDGKRSYWHRFAWLNKDGELRRLSLPFVFEERQIEFCAGLAYHPNGNDLILTYGVRDAEAKLATVNIEEAAQMIWKFHEN